MSISTMLAARVADRSMGQETPGLWAIARVVIGAQAPIVSVSQREAEMAVTELARMGRTELAEALSQAIR